MAAFIARTGEPFCADCRYSLRGSPRRGRCPECGGHYYLSIPEPPPGFLGLNRLAARCRARSRYTVERARPSLRTLAIMLLILGSTGITVGFGWYAWESLLDQIGGR